LSEIGQRESRNVQPVALIHEPRTMKGGAMIQRILIHAACIVKRPSRFMFYLAGIMREVGICI
jgi:hypothetical protein